MPDSLPEEKPAEKAVESDVKEPSTDPSPVDPAKEAPPAEKVEEAPKGDKGDKGDIPGEDMLSRVKAALKPKETPPVSKPDPESKPDPDPAKKEGEEGEDEDEFTEEELSQLKAKTRRRFERLTAHNSALKTELDTFKPKSEQFDKIVGFVEEAGLSRDEVNQLFDIGKALKQDPRKAYEAIRPVYDQLQRMFGDVLPDDLNQRVQQGYITGEDAKALAAARTEAAIAEQTAARLRSQGEQRQEAERRQTHAGEVRTKVSEWESSKEKTDPDWKLKRTRVMELAELAVHRRVAEGKPPPDAVESVQIAESALKTVNDEFKSLAPRPKPVAPVTDVASSRSEAVPSNLLEAARRGLAQAHGGA